jgi:hypothetical protein
VNFTNNGTVNGNVGTLTLTGALSQTSTINVASGATITKIGGFTNAGTIQGNGTVNVGAGNTLTNTGAIRPGGTGSAGTLSITGHLDNSTGTIEAELGGVTVGTQYDRLAVSGNVTATGHLTTSTINSFVPSGQSFDVITSGGTMSGSFTTSTFPSGVNGAIVTTNTYRLTHSGVACTGVC